MPRFSRFLEAESSQSAIIDKFNLKSDFDRRETELRMFLMMECEAVKAVQKTSDDELTNEESEFAKLYSDHMTTILCWLEQNGGDSNTVGNHNDSESDGQPQVPEPQHTMSEADTRSMLIALNRLHNGFCELQTTVEDVMCLPKGALTKESPSQEVRDLFKGTGFPIEKSAGPNEGVTESESFSVLTSLSYLLDSVAIGSKNDPLLFRITCAAHSARAVVGLMQYREMRKNNTGTITGLSKNAILRQIIFDATKALELDATATAKFASESGHSMLELRAFALQRLGRIRDAETDVALLKLQRMLRARKNGEAGLDPLLIAEPLSQAKDVDAAESNDSLDCNAESDEFLQLLDGAKAKLEVKPATAEDSIPETESRSGKKYGKSKTMSSGPGKRVTNKADSNTPLVSDSDIAFGATASSSARSSGKKSNSKHPNDRFTKSSSLSSYNKSITREKRHPAAVYQLALKERLRENLISNCTSTKSDLSLSTLKSLSLSSTRTCSRRTRNWLQTAAPYPVPPGLPEGGEPRSRYFDNGADAITGGCTGENRMLEIEEF